MFSIHLKKSNMQDAAKLAEGWVPVDSLSLYELADKSLKHPISWCIWRKGRRKKCNFQSADFVGLDIDGGMSLEDARKKFASLQHVIGTSKSHQVEKNGSKNDRYHIFLPLESRTFDALALEDTLGLLAKEIGADKCFDAARFFWPCREIVSVNPIGEKLAIKKKV